MTINDICDHLQECIAGLSLEVVQQPWTWSFHEANPDAVHVENYAESLRKTREYFDMKGDQQVSAVQVGDLILALTGTSPTSAARARYFTSVHPIVLQALITAARWNGHKTLEELTQEFQEQHGKADVI